MHGKVRGNKRGVKISMTATRCPVKRSSKTHYPMLLRFSFRVMYIHLSYKPIQLSLSLLPPSHILSLEAQNPSNPPGILDLTLTLPFPPALLSPASGSAWRCVDPWPCPDVDAAALFRHRNVSLRSSVVRRLAFAFAFALAIGCVCVGVGVGDGDGDGVRGLELCCLGRGVGRERASRISAARSFAPSEARCDMNGSSSASFDSPLASPTPPPCSSGSCTSLPPSSSSFSVPASASPPRVLCLRGHSDGSTICWKRGSTARSSNQAWTRDSISCATLGTSWRREREPRRERTERSRR